GVFRVAQEGVPAIIGFRWEVKTSEATQFTARLHQMLAGGAPLGRAYLDAVRVLTPDCPAFHSAMLVVQQDPWAGPAVEVVDVGIFDWFWKTVDEVRHAPVERKEAVMLPPDRVKDDPFPSLVDGQKFQSGGSYFGVRLAGLHVV